MRLVDTNVLLEATVETRAHHETTRQLLEQGLQLAIAAQVIREYLVVATRPVTANGFGLSRSDALDNIAEFRTRLRLLPEEKAILPTFLTLVAETDCRGKRLHDLHILATAITHGVDTVITLNESDLAPIAGPLSILTPAEALADP